jgi:beta-xylosidase
MQQPVRVWRARPQARHLLPVLAGSGLSVLMAVATPGLVAIAAPRPELGAGAGSVAGSAVVPELSTMSAGSSLEPGQTMTAAGGRYVLEMERDGDLALLWLSKPVWQTNTEGHNGAHAQIQHDGNFVVYMGTKALWSSGTGGHSYAAYTVSVLSNGNIVVSEPSGAGMWSSKSETAGVHIVPEGTPAFNGDAGDPNVVRNGTTYYAFTTGTALGNHIQVLVSSEPSTGYHSYTNKAYGSTGLPSTPSWEQPNTQTSPGVFAYDKHWVMFYDASLAGHSQGTGFDCISVATATTLTASSPVFIDRSSGPLICQPGYGGVLDPTPFYDSATGKAYVLWKSNDGSSSQASHIWSQELNAAGTGLAGSPVELLTNNTNSFPWETTLDDPSMVNDNGRDFLMFSVGDFLSAGYSESFAACSGPTGPCTQPAGLPFLKSYDQAYGPGGGSLFSDASGNWWIDYAAWNSSSCQSYSCGARRLLYVAPIDLGG